MLAPPGSVGFEIVDVDGEVEVVLVHDPIETLFVLDVVTRIAADDCNENGFIDACEIDAGTSVDIDEDGVPDECQPDCDEDGIPDAYAITQGLVADCDTDGLPDVCAEGDEIPDDCESRCLIPGDCGGNGRLDLPDAICLLLHLFSGPVELPCGTATEANRDLLDWQGDGRLDLIDPVALLVYLFSGGPPHVLGVPGSERTSCVPIAGCE